MVSQHCHWRTVEEWRDLNVPLSTPSNEASRMYDATLTQLAAHWDDPSVGGIHATLKQMMDADPNFVVGQAMTVGLQVMGGGTSTRLDPKLKTAVEDLVKKAEGQPNLAPAEKKHVKAVKQWADGYLKEACVTWEDILVDHPHDLLALKSAYLGYIYTGNSAQLRDSPARVLPEWSPSTPLYSFLLGMHAFGLEETNLYDRAEKQALRALELNRHDTWATHSMNHVLEMTGQQDRGIHFLRSTLDDWEVCRSLACHHWWHLALHYIEKGEYLEALEIFDSEVKSRCVKQRELFNIADAASLLFRLELEGMDVVNKWRDIQDVSESHLEDAVFAFNDLHLMMSCLGSGDKKASQHFLESLEEHVRNGQGTTRDVHSHTGLKICQALTAYKEGDFAQATDIMYPLRYDVPTLGGSHAQRDIFNIFLIVSALQSPKAEHHRKARALLAERKGLKENSPLTDRLIARVTAFA
ncbi:tetratricopeptide repeat protein 38-like [Littorina saxatilis]|uniref:Tetratricopeptide repeat protein 38 n=1 Tax=Littorina saxatilis TaxID=31220 RepID=A0AAN9ARL8_9CAEN